MEYNAFLKEAAEKVDGWPVYNKALLTEAVEARLAAAKEDEAKLAEYYASAEFENWRQRAQEHAAKKPKDSPKGRGGAAGAQKRFEAWRANEPVAPPKPEAPREWFCGVASYEAAWLTVDVRDLCAGVLLTAVHDGYALDTVGTGLELLFAVDSTAGRFLGETWHVVKDDIRWEGVIRQAAARLGRRVNPNPWARTNPFAKCETPGEMGDLLNRVLRECLLENQLSPELFKQIAPDYALAYTDPDSEWTHLTELRDVARLRILEFRRECPDLPAMPKPLPDAGAHTELQELADWCITAQEQIQPTRVAIEIDLSQFSNTGSRELLDALAVSPKGVVKNSRKLYGKRQPGSLKDVLRSRGNGLEEVADSIHQEGSTIRLDQKIALKLKK